MIQMINTQKLVSLLKDEMSHDDLIAGLREIFDGYGKEIVHIERSIGDLPVSTGGNGGTTTWGSINGTLSDQTDLNAALSGKANVSHSHTGYEPTISKSTGYATWTGAAWSFKNESYSLSTHNHDGTYSLVSHDHSGVYSPVGHDHSGVYEPVISKSTGYLTWTGSAWSWKNEAYSLSSHNHSGVYATVIHNLIDTTNHPVSGLTTGHFLKATGATTYAFAAHGLTYSDVGAQASHANLTSLAGLTYASASFVKMTAAGTFTLDTNTYSLSSHNHSGVYEPVIAAGTSAQFWRGDKTWQTLNQAAVAGLTTASTPQFTGIGLNTAAEASVAMKASGQYYSAKYTQAYAASTTVNWNNGNVQYIALTGNITTLTLSNPKDGCRYLLILKQDATGSRTVAWPASVKWPGSTAPTLSGANKYDIIAFVYDGTNALYHGQYSLNY